MSREINFNSKSLTEIPQGRIISGILNAAISAVDPEIAVEKVLRLEGNVLEVSGTKYNLEMYENVYIVGGGKASAPMAKGVLKVLAERIDNGIIVVKDGHGISEFEKKDSKIEQLNASHPIPDFRSVNASQKIIAFLQNLTEKDLLICLISGGASALLTSPRENISLLDIQNTTHSLINSGATINQINVIRKKMDNLKGGGLARFAYPATVITLILSDVIGDPLDIIASGPTVISTATDEEVKIIFEKYLNKNSSVLSNVKEIIFQDDNDSENPLVINDKIFENVQNLVVGNNKIAAEAAKIIAEKEGFTTSIISLSVEGEAREVGKELIMNLQHVINTDVENPRPLCLIAGGETTVTVKGIGKGGRNQEMALSTVKLIDNYENVLIITLATDGGDGPTNAAGAVVNGKTYQRGIELGLDSEDYLIRNDSYNYFKALDDLLVIGPTKTNVNDLIFLFAF